jgi:hypothetical protein
MPSLRDSDSGYHGCEVVLGGGDGLLEEALLGIRHAGAVELPRIVVEAVDLVLERVTGHVE